MTFAHWTNTPANPGLADAEQFITDIPEGTRLEDVIAKLVLVCGVSMEETDKRGFEKEWPPEIKREFLDPDSDASRRSWAELK
jgi:hypothetical protein